MVIISLSLIPQIIATIGIMYVHDVAKSGPVILINLLKSFFVSGGFAEVNPEKCIVLGETVEEMNSLDKNLIEKEIQELQNKDTDESKQQILIANAKIEALNASFYEKI